MRTQNLSVTRVHRLSNEIERLGESCFDPIEPTYRYSFS